MMVETLRDVLQVKPFELLIALRYLMAKRKQAVIAVISLIGVLGITAGVAVLVIALALVNGFNRDIQGKLLEGTAHLNLLRKDGQGIKNAHERMQEISVIPGIRAVAPTSYDSVYIFSAGSASGIIIKGVDLNASREANEVWSTIIEGQVESLATSDDEVSGIILGKGIAEELGLKVGDYVNIIPPEGTLTPFGLAPKLVRFRVVGLFRSGLYEYDSSWGYVSLETLKRLLGTENPVKVLQMKLADIYAVKETARRVLEVVGPNYTTTDWQELNQPVFAALQIQRLVVVIILTLMIFIAALNIITSLVMMVIEKTKDISILMAMGARPNSIMRIFMLQGLLIGLIGTAMGLLLGAIACHVADKYELIRLPETMFSISYAPFKPRVFDAAIVALIAVLISFLATIYPARSAARLDPVEGLRYE